MPMTGFEPLSHGFHFVNTFQNHVGPITTDGLCGGMSYSALDYFYAGRPVPLTRYPEEGTPLRDYLFARQLDSLVSQVPGFTSRLGSFWNGHDVQFGWGVKEEHELGRLRRTVDAGRPAPLGLINVRADLLAHHQVVAVGYDTGRCVDDLRIHVYDPNFPGVVVTMIPVPAENRFRVAMPDGRDTGCSWRTYFVDEGYRTQTPPDISPAGLRQRDWRWCGKCRALAYGGDGPGACAAGGSHDHAGSGDYVVVAEAPHYQPQDGWRWCRNCKVLAYAGHGAGACAAGGTHDHGASYNYAVPYDAPAEPGQDGWRWCKRCHALAYAADGPGVCPAGGTHDHSESGAYRVAHL